MFYFGQVFFSAGWSRKRVRMVSTSNITYSEQIYRSTFFHKYHHTLCFWLRREARQMPNTEELLYQTKNKQPPKVFYKNVVLKNFAMFTGTPILKNICVRLQRNWLFERIVWNFVSGSHLEPFWLSNITKILVTFKPEL